MKKQSHYYILGSSSSWWNDSSSLHAIYCINWMWTHDWEAEF